jgi:hypothetical protein
VRVIEDSGWPSPARGLDRLTTGEDESVTDTSHAACPGHVGWTDEAYMVVLADGTVVDEDDDWVSDEQYARPRANCGGRSSTAVTTRACTGTGSTATCGPSRRCQRPPQRPKPTRAVRPRWRPNANGSGQSAAG